MHFLKSGTLISNILRYTAEKRHYQCVKEKVAVVTASTDGIGLAIAHRLLKDGMNVIISSRHDENVKYALKKLQKENLTGRIEGIVCHVGKHEDRSNLFEKVKQIFGKLDVLVSNTAVNPSPESLLTCSEEVWDKIFDINVKSALLLTREAVPLLQQSEAASIIFVSSVLGYHPRKEVSAYSISKTALFGLCKALALELAPMKIRVNSIAPGLVKTKFSKIFYTDQDKLQELLNEIPLGRMAEPEEMAGIVSYLASKDSSYVTGENFVLAGGMHSHF